MRARSVLLVPVLVALLASGYAQPAFADLPDPLGTGDPVDLPVAYPPPGQIPGSASVSLPPPLPETPPQPPSGIGGDLAEPEPPTEGWNVVSHWERNDDDTISGQFYAGPQFRPVNGTWLPIDPALTSLATGAVTSAASLLPVTFGLDTAHVATFVLPDGVVTESWTDATRLLVPTVDGQTVTYADVAPGADLLLDVGPGGVKERIVLADASARRTWHFHLSDPSHALGDLVALGDDAYRFDNPIAEDTYVELPSPYAYEQVPDGVVPPVAKGSAHQTVTAAGDGYDVTLSVDEDWLADKSFPIVLDPSVHYTNTQVTSWEHSRNSPANGSCGADPGGCIGYVPPASNPNAMGPATQTEKVGSVYNIDARPARAFYKFSTSSIQADSLISVANLILFQNGCFGFDPTLYECDNHNYSIQHYPLTALRTVNNTYTEVAAATGSVLYTKALNAFAPGTRVSLTMDIRAILNYWISSGNPNYGLGQKLSSEPSTGNLGGPSFSGVNDPVVTQRPVMDITWSPPPGAPRSVTASAPNNSTVNVTYAAPVDNGGPAISSYTTTLYRSDGSVYTTSSCNCLSRSFTSVPYGSYYAKVYATNSVGAGPTSAASNTVTLSPAPQLAKTVSPVLATYGRGQELTYTLRVSNPVATSMVVDSVSDAIPAGLVATNTPVTLAGVACTVCSFAGTTLNVGSFTVPGSGFVDIVYKAVALGTERICQTVTNTAQAANSYGSTNSSVPVTICDSALGVESWWSYVRQGVAADSDAMVNVANGNLVVQSTDSTPVLGRGRLAHVVRRTYNSQDTQALTLPGSIGGGWQLNLGQTDDLAGLGVTTTGLSVPSATTVAAPMAVTLIDRDGTRHVFTFKSLATSVSLSSVSGSTSIGSLLPRVLDTTQYANVCVDGTYTAPRGVHLSLYRYVGVSSSGCGSLSTGTVLGFAAVRPDRLRTEYSWNGRLLSMVDGSGNELRYKYEQAPLAGANLGRLTNVYESNLKPTGGSTCAVTLLSTCRQTTITYPNANEIRVTDPAGRATRYLLDGATPVSHLVTVVNPPEVSGASASDHVSYTYDGFGDDCDGTGTNTGQLCQITDARGYNSRFTYSAATLGPKRVTAMRDRRGNTTTISYYASPDYVTADKGTHRTRYLNIDASGRVGEVDEGATNDVYQHVTTNAWDAAGSTCRQPDNVVDNNLCSVTRSSLTASANEVTTFVYNTEGGLLAQRKANTGGTPSSIDTTFGYTSQYVRADGTTWTADDTVAGSGTVTSGSRPVPGSGSPVLFAIMDRTQMLPPRGNVAGATVANYRTNYAVARSTSANPNSTVSGSSCSSRNSGVLCLLSEPFEVANGSALTSYTYDDYGQRVTMRTPRGYYDCGDVTYLWDCKTYTYTYYPDTELDLSNGVTAGGWLKGVRDPNGAFVAFGYDRAGNIARTWDRNQTGSWSESTFPVTTAGSYTGTTRGSLNAPWKYVTSQRDPMGGTTTYTVDQNGNPVYIRPPRGTAANSASYDIGMTYDGSGNLLTTLLPTQVAANKRTIHTYDIWNNRVSTTDPNGSVAVTTYDNVNRVTGTKFTRGAFPSDGSQPPACQQAATTAADAPLPIGKLACTTGRSYDGLDNLVSEMDADHQVTSYVYDAVKRLVRVDRPRNDGVLTTLRTDTVYDADGHITDVCPPRSFAEGGAATCASTDPYGTHTTYDEAGRRRSVTTYRSAGGAALTTTWTYDRNGNALTVTDQNGRTTTNTYDRTDRLTSQSVPRDASFSNVTFFTYDAVGNLRSKTEPGALDTGTGADGDLTVDGALYPSGYVMPANKNFRNLTLTNGAVVTIADWTAGGNGRLEIKATGTITICGGCSISVRGKGLPGGIPSASLTAPSGSGQGAGPGTGGSPGALTGGGGGGAGHGYYGTDGSTTTGAGAAGTAGAAYGSDPVTGAQGNADLGSGGGAGGPGGTSLGGAGGAGGGYIHLTANRIVNNGLITTEGLPGATGATGLGGSSGGGGGGGSGGDVWLTAPQLAGSGSVYTSGANGGTGGGSNGATNTGGNGSWGRTRYQSDDPQWSNEPVGRITAYSYDANNRLVDTVHAASSRTASSAGTTSANGSANIRTRLLYDVDGHVVAELDPKAFTSSVSSPDARFMRRIDYDTDGRQIAMWSPRYDGSVATDLGLSSAQTTQCTTSPAPQSVSGVPSFPSGVGVCVTRMQYDPAGNKSRITLPTSNGTDNRYVTFGYSDDNLPLTTNTPDPTQVSGTGRVTASTNLYDASGRVVKATDALGHQRVAKYTSDGLLASVAGQLTAPGVNRFEEYLYDADGHRTRTTTWLNHAPVDPQPTPIQRVSSATYWTDGLKKDVYGTGTSASDSNRDRTSYTYDNTGNVTSVKSPSANAMDASNLAGSATTYTYSYDNLLLTATVPVASNGTTFRRTTYGYDPAGRKATERVDVVNAAGLVQTAGGVQSFSYLPSDLLSVQTGRNGETIAHSYDAGGRATSIVNTPASGSAVSLTATYYLDGLPRTATSRGRTTQWSYDGSSARTALSELVDATGARTTTTYSYSDGGKLASATSDVTGTTQSWTYDVAGRGVSRTLPNGTSVTRTYNADDSVANQTLSTVSTGAILARWDYTYDGKGRIKAAHLGTTSTPSLDCTPAPGSLPSGLQCMSYDAAGRLSQFKDSTADRALTWDHDGNRLTYGPSGAEASYTYNADDTMATSKASPSAATKSYTYAPFGGQLTDGGCTTDTYDGFDRVLTTTSSGGSGCDPARTVAYTYDGLDRQATRTESGTGAVTPGTSSLFYDGLGESFLAEVLPDGATSDYEQVVGHPIAVRRTGSGAATQYLTDDGQGSVTTTLSTAGAVACSIRYDAFGGTASTTDNPCSTGTTPSTLLYRSGRRDSATKSYQLGARTYDPGRAGFRTPDTFRAAQPSTGLAVGTDPLTRNSYTYVNGDPINLADPDGHMQVDPGGGWGDYEAFKKHQRKVEMAEALGVPVELNGKPRPEKGKDSLGWAIGEARLNARCGGKCDWSVPGFWSMDTLSTMGKAAANIPSGVGEGLARFGEGLVNTPSMVVQGYANIGQLIKNPSMSSDDLISTPKAHVGHVPAVYKDSNSMAAYKIMSVTTQVAATVATAKLPGKVKAIRASRAGGAGAEAASVETAVAKTASAVEGDAVQIFRGTKEVAENEIAQQTGKVMSDAARRGFEEGGQSIAAARAASESAHTAGVQAWGSEATYAEAHAAFGHDLSAVGQRSMISWTTDIERAKYFAGDYGTVYTATISRAEGIWQTLEGAGESEVLIRHMIEATPL